MRILVVDDTKAVHAFVESVFSSTSCELEHVYNGQEALQLHASKWDFDVVLLDWEMPVLSGIDTLKAMRERGVTTPIVMVTSKNLPDEISQALELGASEYVLKPFTDDILFEKISFVTGHKVA